MNISLEDYFSYIDKDFFINMQKREYYVTESTFTSFVLEHSQNMDKIVIKCIDDNILLNCINSNGNIFLPSDWYIGKMDYGIKIQDIYDIIDKNGYKHFAKCEKMNNMQQSADTELTETQQKIMGICYKMSELLIYKNKKYGNSALNPQKMFYKGDTQNSILIRLDDKLSRIINNTEDIRTNDICDIIGYLVLLLVAKNVSLQDIDNLKD